MAWKTSLPPPTGVIQRFSLSDHMGSILDCYLKGPSSKGTQKIMEMSLHVPGRGYLIPVVN